MDLSAFLKQVTEAPGVSGYEAPVREVIRQEWARYTHETLATPMGSLIGIRRGTGPEPRRKVMLAAHMDEIGLIATGIDKGFIRISRVGGSDARIMLGQQVIVHGARDLPGVIGSRPPHVLPADQHDNVLPFDKLFVDVGLPESEVREIVHVGDIITIQREAQELKGGLFAAKALDDRASVAAVTVCLEALANRYGQHRWDVMAVATVQEENTYLGATTSAYRIQPDVAIAIDVTFAEQNDIIDQRLFKLGCGPTLGVGPNFHPKMVEALQAAGDRLEMPVQLEPAPGASGTDAWPIQVAREGIPTALLGIALRYMHTPVEVVSLKDIERTGRLMAEFIAALDDEFCNTLTYSLD